MQQYRECKRPNKIFRALGLKFPMWVEGLGWDSMRVGFASLGAPKGLAGSMLSAKHWELEAPQWPHPQVALVELLGAAHVKQRGWEPGVGPG